MEDVKGAFLHAKFDNNEAIYFKVPQGWEENYEINEYYVFTC